MVTYLSVVPGILLLGLGSTVIQGSESHKTDMSLSSLLLTDVIFRSLPSSAIDIKLSNNIISGTYCGRNYQGGLLQYLF
jgi:hypothetical protein